MINVEEHIYHDDPKAGHPDVRTQLPDVRYYFIGNGLIQAAIQHAPAGEGSLYGLLLMNPEWLGMKREALSFDPETGLEKTMLCIYAERGGHPLPHDKLCVKWDHRLGLPAIRVDWRSGALAVC